MRELPEPKHTIGKHGAATSAWNKINRKRYVVSTIDRRGQPETAIFPTVFQTAFSLPWKLFVLYHQPGISDEFRMMNHMMVVWMVQDCERKLWSLTWIQEVLEKAKQNIPQDIK